MKKTFIALLCIFAAALFAAELTDATVVKTNRSYHKHSKRYGKGEYYQFNNSFGKYLLYFQWVKPTDKSSGGVSIGLPEPQFWNAFSNRGFMSIRVNDISSYSVEPRNIRMENGAVLADYNFDGAVYTIKWYMKKDSPLLFIALELKPDGEPVEKLSVHVSAHPSNARGKKAEFRREFITAVKTHKFKPSTNGTAHFGAKENYVIMTDAFYNPGPNDKKSLGPCFIQWTPQGVKGAKCWFGANNTASYTFTLDPKTTKWEFAVLERKVAMSNADFIKYLQDNKIIPAPAAK